MLLFLRLWCESTSTQYSAQNVKQRKQQGLFLPLILSYLRLGRNRDRGATVPPVRSPGGRIRVGFVMELFSLVKRHSLMLRDVDLCKYFSSWFRRG
jgi:hypothetical protein